MWIGVVYLSTRVLLLLAAYLLSSFGHHNFLHELANWDGLWYRELANHGYPDYPSHLQTTLGFFPLYPITIWTLEPLVALITGHNAIWSATVAGVIISMIGGFVATVLVYRLATGWWNRDSARRATILFCLFPGSVVFSMVYSEGLLLPLAAGCLLALEHRRWLLAGILAGIGTAVQPSGLVLVVICAVSAALELHRRGWRLNSLAARRVLVAPILSLAGVSAFALFLWAWTGTPFANYQAQHHGWGEKTDFFALVHLTTTLFGQISPSHPNEPTVNLNLVVGLIGAFLLLGMLVLVWRARRTISVEAIVWTVGISFLALTSEYVPPNPRMLITAFPALMVVAHYVRGKWFTWLAWGNGILLVVLSLLTFYGVTLRP
jgi:Gpi18-like mannosyltransferase